MVEKKNSKTSIVAIAAAVIIAIAGIGTAAYALTLDTSENEVLVSEMKHERGADDHAHTKSDKQAAAPTVKSASAVIAYGDAGFEQATYSVKSGETVRVENKAKQEFYFTTGDHHNHDVDSPLNVGTIAPGKSSSFVAPKAGTYPFHNHDNDAQAGELIVE